MDSNKPTKQEIYGGLIGRVATIARDERNAVSVLANVAAELHTTLGHWWTGFYIERDGELQLGPFQGPVACTRIAHGRGVCGTAWQQGSTIVVPNVHEFPGHIACSSLSQSEIVVPIIDAAGNKLGVIDIDSKHLGTFDIHDQAGLEQIAAIVATTLSELPW